ncbi:MAG: sialidase family protein [Archangium sp.]|nr:sialidase family protein [Archangium sp.]
MRHLILLSLFLGCGSPVPGADGGAELDAGPLPIVDTRQWTELPEETLAVECRPVIGARFHSLDPAAPQHWRAEASNVLLRSADEGRTWTRAPLDHALGALMVGPVVLAYGNTEPLRLNFAQWLGSDDRGQTWAPLVLTPTTDPALPAGSLTALVGATRVAWTPTGRVLYSEDQGQTWRSEPDAVQPRFGDDWQSTLGDREWVAHADERSVYASRDRGRTWARKTWQHLQAAFLLGEQGLAAQGFEGNLWLSEDDGETWSLPEQMSGALAAGPADGEVWALSKPLAPETPRLMHSRDWGRSFAPVRLRLGAAGETTAATPSGRVSALADGRRVFRLELTGLSSLSVSVTCIETAGAGALEQPSPAKSDAPGTATLWATRGVTGGQALGSTQQVVPLAEPGRAYWLGQQTFSDAVSINGGTRTASGTVALLLQPAPVLRRDLGPAMFVRELEPAGLTPTVITHFDNLLELGTSGQQKFLESHTLQALPDGTFRTDTTEGDYPLGGATAMWAPWPEQSRWGRLAAGVAVVTKDFIGATQHFRLTRDLLEAPVFCDPATIPTERCLSYPGHVADFAHRDGQLYVLDDWKGEVVVANFAALNNQWRPVLTGLAKPTSLFLPLDEDPGLYVVDTHLYRFVAAPLVPGRRP